MSQTTIVQDVFTLKEKIFLTPNFIRIVLTGNVALFKDCTLGDNNKIFVPGSGQPEVHMRSFDTEKNEWVLPPKDLLPAMRTYTHRGLDLEKNELYLDFANHGLGGPASAWANEAQAGYQIGVAMKSKSKQLYPEADWYLLAGDMTAIPVLSVILEGLPSSAKGTCIIEVHGKEDEQVLETKADIEFIWTHNPTPENGSKLAEAVKKVTIPETSKFGFVACEFSSVKEIRSYLRKEQEWTANELYAFSYWKSGASEEESGSARREEKETV